MTEELKTSPQYSQRLQHLEQRTYHIDGEVTAIKSQLSTQNEALQRIENSLLNRPSVWNTGSIISLLGLVGSIVFGGAVYLESQMGNVEEDIHELAEYVDIQQEFRHQMHYEVGRMTQTVEEYDRKWDHFDMLMHKRDDRINEIEKKQAESTVSRRAIGDYARELGQRLEGLHP